MADIKVHPVIHYNKIGHEINESINEYPNFDRTIYCRQLHTVATPELNRCLNCPLFYDSMGAFGIACRWDDAIKSKSVVIPHDDCQKEFMRVSKLMDDGILQKGW